MATSPSEECQADFLKKWPQWNETDIMSLRDQFMIFDVNCDGLIDYPELLVAPFGISLALCSRMVRMHYEIV
jgi:Ca2+-binding EF-hand superfamily protein